MAAKSIGRKAIENFRIPPLVDGSIRREPDFEHVFPGVSGLCRGDRFAKRLEAGDRVAYITRKNKFGKSRSPHYRLTAVLEVLESLPTHEAAATWYRSRNLALPNNCMVAGNDPKRLDESHRDCNCGAVEVSGDIHELWDRQYRERAARHPTFVVCRPQYCELSWNAPIVSDDDLREAFGSVPLMQNPEVLDGNAFDGFLNLLEIGLISRGTSASAARIRRRRMSPVLSNTLVDPFAPLQ